ncbi:MAG: glycosyltransferase family 4 protein [Opitutaceae bacterium]|nr:glycosyltransferase family 4 protein [Opitutaceae bacterium]
MRVHLLDPQLSGPGGHYSNHDAQLIRELRRRGIEVELHGRKGASIAVEGIDPHPVFTHDIFQEFAKDPAVWAMENFHAGNEVFLADLQSIPADKFSSADLIYLPNLLQNQLHAVVRWLSAMPASGRPAVAIMLRYLNHAMDYVQKRANKELIALYYRFAGRALKEVQPRSLICADTRELAAAYQQIIGVPVLELPNPMDVAPLLARLEGKGPVAGAAPVIVYQGHTSPLRGFHFLPDLINRCSRMSPRPRFVIQVQNRASAPSNGLGPSLAQLDKLAATPGSGVKLVEGALSPDDYFALLGEADIVLLPYAPTFYGVGSSGVFTEAASVGKVIVVSPQTVPARQGAEYGLGVVSAAKWEPAAMADAVRTALGNLPALREKAEKGAPGFRAEQCAAALWEKVFSALPRLNATESPSGHGDA